MAKNFITCEKCGKRLIERLPNGLLKFKFGRRRDTSESVVEMLIHGDVKMKCLKTATEKENMCEEWTEIRLWPFDNIKE